MVSMLVHGLILIIIIFTGQYFKDSDILNKPRYLNVVLGAADAGSSHIQRRHEPVIRSDVQFLCAIATYLLRMY